jgi:hypothetical protein
MEQSLDADNHTDRDGNPAGGVALSTGLTITWQNGPLGRGENRKEPNGAFVETVIEAVINRLYYYQDVAGGKFACRQNALALTKLEEAKHWLQDRTREREARGVEGTHQP